MTTGPGGRVQVDVGGVGAALTVATICTLCIGIGVGFIFGMNVYGCPWIMSRAVVNDVCQCDGEDLPVAPTTTQGLSIFLAEIRPVRQPPRPGQHCTVRVLLANDDGTRSWIDTRRSCIPK